MSVLPVHPAIYYGLLAFCLLLGLGLMALAWRRPRTRQRPARLLAGAVAAGALWLVVFPPPRPLPATRAEAILLTSGYLPDTLRQLRHRLGAGTPVWAYGKLKIPAGAQPLTSLLTLAEQQPALQNLHVLGDGLPAAELPLLSPLAIRLHPGAPVAGFGTAFWSAKLALGAALQIDGTVLAAPGTARPAAAWVVLRATGASRDSVRLPLGSGPFRLRYRPKIAGLATYALLLRRPGQPPWAEPIPVEITTPTLPAVLLLTATPAFEFKFLKNYLAETHCPVALRTSVSRDLVQTDFVNQPALALNRLTPTVLARYSVVVADAATLAALPQAEARGLQAAIRAGRLGLVVLAGAAPLPHATPAHADFVVRLRAATSAALPALTWPDAPTEARAPLPTQLQPDPALRPLISGPNQALVAASRRVGLGFVVVSVVPETFRWGLLGHTAVYASFWNRLLAAAVPPAPARAIWRTGTRWPRPAQPLTLHLTAAFPLAQPTVVPLGGGPTVRLALRQDTRLPEWSTAPFWPGAAGWHQVRGPGRTTHNFYVYPATAWPEPERQERQERQQAVAQLNTPTQIAPASAVAPNSASEPWPAGWFFGLFLLATGYLWLEEKR